jgi:ribulose-5-phosphate 4-epimerase/fuculose-1-phosphate aldolase
VSAALLPRCPPLEIYKEAREAKAVVHCHPARATTYSITQRVPATCVISEYS